MALWGALAENTRRGERVERGLATVTGSLVITVPGPMRSITNVDVTMVQTTSGVLDPAAVTVGNVGSGGGNKPNQFTIFVWKSTSSANPTLITSTTASQVYWQAQGVL